MNKEILFKTNEIILANTDFEFTSKQYKLFNKIMYNCQKTNNQKERVAIITYEELKEIFNHSNECSIKNIESLFEAWRTISIKYTTNKVSSGTGLLLDWERKKDSNDFYLFIKSDFYEILMNYKNLGYSPIDIKLVRRAKGYYTQKLYELLKIWSGTRNKSTYTIEELRDYFKIGEKYSVYKDFKKRVIKPSINEIKEKLNMDVDFTENKVGKKVVSLTFCIIDYEPRHYNFKEIHNVQQEVLKGQVGIEYVPKEMGANSSGKDIEEIVSSATMKAIKQLERYKINISAQALERNLNTYGEDLFNRAVNTIINQKESGKEIIVPVNYLNGTLETLKANDEVAVIKAKNEGTKILNFTNYSQRTYDYDSLEKQLLGWDE